MHTLLRLYFILINIITKGFNKKNIKINEKPYKVDFCYLDANLCQFWQLLLSKGPSTSKLAKNIIDIYVYFFQNMISLFSLSRGGSRVQFVCTNIIFQNR